MGLPTFNGFSLQDSNFIAERITFKGYADRAVIRGKINRREGIKLMATEFGEKQISIEGKVIASDATSLQSLIDDMKKNLTEEEGSLIIENGRTFRATVSNLVIPDEHYNQSRAPFEVTFICSDPFSTAAQVSAVIPVTSGIATLSGMITISGTFFNRPVLTYTPGAPTTGESLITKLVLYHVPTGQSITVSGFGGGTNLGYQNEVVINMDDFITLEGSTNINNSGAFPRWEPGSNQFTLTATPQFPGGSVEVSHSPRYL